MMVTGYETEQSQRELGDNFAEFLIAMRDLSGFTQTQMSKDIGISKACFTNWIKGARIQPEYIETIKSLFELTDYETDNLVERSNFGQEQTEESDIIKGYYDFPLCKVEGDSRVWMKNGNCSDVSVDTMFPYSPYVSRGAESRAEKAAKKICAGCTEINYCLEYALTFHIEEGVWGGATEAERVMISERRESLLNL